MLRRISPTKSVLLLLGATTRFAITGPRADAPPRDNTSAAFALAAPIEIRSRAVISATRVVVVFFSRDVTLVTGATGTDKRVRVTPPGFGVTEGTKRDPPVFRVASRTDTEVVVFVFKRLAGIKNGESPAASRFSLF